jgi:hypothetical protein
MHHEQLQCSSVVATCESANPSKKEVDVDCNTYYAKHNLSPASEPNQLVTIRVQLLHHHRLVHVA